MNSRRIMAMALAVVLVAALALAFVYRRQTLWAKQIRNLELFRSYSRAIAAYEEEHGEYPATLDPVSSSATWPSIEAGRDIWGHPIRYVHDQEHYVLASCGRDGQPDYDDYGQFLASAAVERSICMEWNADQILSDQGWHQVCGK